MIDNPIGMPRLFELSGSRGFNLSRSEQPGVSQQSIAMAAPTSHNLAMAINYTLQQRRSRKTRIGGASS
jgi:hypothetical protein